jgi:hypothetical protein
LLEGSLAEGYAMEEALRLCTKYLQRYSRTRRRVCDKEEGHGVAGVELQGRGTAWLLVDTELWTFHLHVFTNSKTIHDYSKWMEMPHPNVVDTSCESRSSISLFDCIGVRNCCDRWWSHCFGCKEWEAIEGHVNKSTWCF